MQFTDVENTLAYDNVLWMTSLKVRGLLVEVNEPTVCSVSLQHFNHILKITKSPYYKTY